MLFLYDLGIQLYSFFIRLASLRSKKAAYWIRGRRNILKLIENHLDKVESRLEKIHNKLDLKEFDMENIKTLNSVSDVFLDAVKNDCEQTKSVSDLVSILKEVKNADGDLKYSDIAIKVVNDGINYTNDLSNHLSSMHSSFKPKTNYQVFDQAK